MSSSKDPAFLFYSKDWADGTAEMLPEEKGVYIDLLVHHHQHDGIPSDLKKMSRIVRMSEKEFLRIWNEISYKFYEENGRFFNKKMLEVMGLRKEKSVKNKVIGTFASLLRLNTLKPEEYTFIRNEFKCDDWLKTNENELTERLTKWLQERLSNRLKSIANANKSISNITTNYLKEEIYNSETWKINTAKNNGTDVKSLMESFEKFWTLHLYETNPENKTQSEIQIHFGNWVNKNKPPQVKFADEWGIEGVDFIELNVIEAQEETKFNEKISEGWVKYNDYLMRLKLKK